MQDFKSLAVGVILGAFISQQLDTYAYTHKRRQYRHKLTLLETQLEDLSMTQPDPTTQSNDTPPQPEVTATAATQPRRTHRGRWIGLAVATILLLLVAGWGFSVQWEQYRTVTYIIPAGTAANSQEIDIPLEIQMTVGLKDILIIENHDEVDHTLGPFVIPSNGKITQRFKAPLDFHGSCTIHPDQAMTLTVNPAPWADIF